MQSRPESASRDSRKSRTASEAGLPGFESLYWIGMLAPARTPGALVDKLNRDVVDILQTQALQAALLVQGAESRALRAGRVCRIYQ